MPSDIPSSMTWQFPSGPIRLHGLDILRGLATILVVFLHAGIPYMSQPLPYLVWPARDLDPSKFVDGLTWCTECFLMPLFFELAGFFSYGLLLSRGEREFLSERTQRLWLTQVVASFVILPVCLVIWSLGWIADGVVAPQALLEFRLPRHLTAELFGLAHLWFLQYLYIYCLILCGISWWAKQARSPALEEAARRPLPMRGLDRILVSVWKPMIPVIPCAMILYFDTRIVLGFYQGFSPVISKLAYYSIFFSLGVMFSRQRDVLHLHARFGKRYLIAAVIVFTVTLPLIHEHLNVGLTGLRLAILALLIASFASFTTFGLFAVFLRTKCGDNAVTHYLAESSFWVYLIHLPIVVLVQIAMSHLPVPTVCKFLIAGTTGLAMALMTYHVFVRETWLGVFLDAHCRVRGLSTDSCEPALVHGPAVVAPCVGEKKLSTVSS